MNGERITPSCCCDKNVAQRKPEDAFEGVKTASKSLPSVVTSVLIAFFPKCPLCWGIYMSTLGSFGLVQLPYMPWLLPVLVVFFGIHLFLLLKKSSVKGYFPFIASLAGAALILCGRSLFPGLQWLLVSGMLLIISGSLLNSFSGNFKFHLFRLKEKTNQSTI